MQLNFYAHPFKNSYLLMVIGYWLHNALTINVLQNILTAFIDLLLLMMQSGLFFHKILRGPFQKFTEFEKLN
jgi:hypothetical protein